ncbi:tRNA wybutosine-synthesizing protein 4-like [Argonauta hians]
MDTKRDRKGGKTVKSRSNTAVQGTNDFSIVSKCSMVKYGYFQDKFLQYFVAKHSRRTPLIHRGYYIRSFAIDHILKLFLAASKEISGKRQIISLGAGFDTAYFRLKSQGLLENCVFYEVDFLDVVKRKANSIRQVKELKEMIGDLDMKPSSSQLSCVEISSQDYILIGADLTNIKLLDHILRQCQADLTYPTLLLSECVLTYLAPTHSQAVIQWAAQCFSNAVFIDYEQINPNTAFGLFMQNHFKKTGSTLKCINTFPTLQSQIDRFLKLGWEVCQGWDMNDIFFSLVSSTEKADIEQKELFDEFEGWHLVCSHYVVLWASIGSLNNCLQDISNTINVIPRCISKVTEPTGVNEKSLEYLSSSEAVMRFGHSCAAAVAATTTTTAATTTTTTTNTVDATMVNTNATVDVTVTVDAAAVAAVGGSSSRLLLLFGGFGMENLSHHRLPNITIVDLNSLEIDTISTSKLGNHIEVARMYHTNTVLAPDTILLLAGRTSPSKPCQDGLLIKIKMEDKSANTSRLPDSVTAVLTNQDKNEEISSLQFEFGTNPYSLTFKKLEMDGELPCARWKHSVIRFTKNGFPHLMVFGGRTGHSFALDDCYVLNCNSWNWSKIDTLGCKPDALHSHTCCLWKDNFMVLAGGLKQDLLPSSAVYILDLNTFHWKLLDLSGLLYPRYSHTAHIVGDNLILVGGVNLEHRAPGVAAVNLVSGHAQEFYLPAQYKGDEIIMLHGHQSELLNNDRLLVIGGGSNCFSFGTHLNKSMFYIDLKYFLSKM